MRIEVLSKEIEKLQNIQSQGNKVIGQDHLNDEIMVYIDRSLTKELNEIVLRL